MNHLLHSIDSLARANGGLPLAVCELTGALTQTKQTHPLQISLISSKIGQACLPTEQLHSIATDNWIGQLQTSHQQQPINLIHQHGLWVKSSHTTSTFALKNKIPIVISPHGMLEPWALKHHAWRKKLALTLYQKRHLEQAAAFHATCEAEAQHIRQLGFTQPIAVIANGVRLPESIREKKPTGEPRTALFLSRLHPKKGLPMLLEAWAKINPPKWKLVIAGNDEGGHLNVLKSQARQLGLSPRVTFLGPIYDESKAKAFQQADLFILPSHSENFGIVIAEALAHSLPVITTTETPWQILEQKDCGWWVDAQTDAIATALKKATELTPAKLQSMGQSGRELVAKKFLWPKIAKQMLSFYHWLIDEAERPDFVI
ncbi:MAG: glycosyltransferase [Verrucomicrobia bacterium]|nr:glycosyltransferase [Verrucomicrobiota bacterium]